MSHLIRFALSQRIVILLLIALLTVAGMYAVKNIPIDAFPEVSPIQVKIIVKANGMSPEEVESRITMPIEVELLGIPHQTMLRSLAKYALTDITVDFEEGTDIFWARQQVAERLNALWSDLPDGIEGGIAPITTPLGEIFMFSIESERLSLMEKRSLLDWVIRPALRTVKGVADVNALGGLVRSFEVSPDNARLSARHITIQQLITTLQTNNHNDGAGRLNEGEESLIVRTEGRIQSLEDVKQLIIETRQGLPITVADVAHVHIGALTRYGAVTKDGQGEAVTGLVLSLRGANARQTVADIEQKLEEMKASFPEDVTIDVFYNRGHLISTAVSTVSYALIAAIILVVILLILFLGNLTAALTVACSLPLAAMITFILMYTIDMTANLMSLGGLVIAIGMLVDSAIVVVENIMSHLSEQKNKRLPHLHIIYRAVKEVATPVISGTVIIIIVFLPLLSLQGLEGKLFSPVAITIVFALAGALAMSLTAIPVLSSYFIKHISVNEPWLPRQLQKLYQPILHWGLVNTNMVLSIAIGLLIATIFIFNQLGSAFMPEMDEGDIIVQIEKLPSISLEKTVELDSLAQRNLLKHIPEIVSIVARVGTDELGLDPMSLNDTDSFLILKPKSEWRMATKDALIDEIRTVMAKTPGLEFAFTQPIEMRVSEMLTGSSGDIAVQLFGHDLTLLNIKAKETEALLKTIQGATDVFVKENEGMQFLQLDIDHQAAGQLGLSSDDIQQFLRVQIAGLTIGVVQEGIKRTPLIVRGTNDASQFNHLQISLPNGGTTPLSSVATISRTEGVVAIEREKGQRFALIQSNVLDRDLVSFVEEARQLLAEKLNLPIGYHLEFGGEFENQKRATARLKLVIPLSLGLIFLLLFSTFGSAKQALLILSNIPLAMIGGVFALWLSNEYLSVPASVGFIALLGIAVLNGVVMVSYFNQLRDTGMAIAQVVVVGSTRRLRPVMMTATTAAFGLLPLIYASGPGSEIQKPLAIVVIGGLVSSTLLTLIVLPILYQKFNSKITSES